jgi:hypothetical protein
MSLESHAALRAADEALVAADAALGAADAASAALKAVSAALALRAARSALNRIITCCSTLLLPEDRRVCPAAYQATSHLWVRISQQLAG